MQILHRNVDSIDRRPPGHSHNGQGPDLDGGAAGTSPNPSSATPGPAAATAGAGGTLVVRCQNLRILWIRFARADDLSDVADSLEKLSAFDDIARSFPFFFRADFRALEDGWTTFDPLEEFAKLLRAPDSEWRVSNVNKDYSVRTLTNAH